MFVSLKLKEKDYLNFLNQYNSQRLNFYGFLRDLWLTNFQTHQLWNKVYIYNTLYQKFH